MSMCMTFPVGQRGAFLATRNIARAILADLEERIASNLASEVVLVDFGAVDAMTISFADEFLGRFYTALAAGHIRAVAVLLRGLNEETAETITICLERRELIAAALVDGGKALIGAQDFLAESYRHALELRRFKAGEFAAALGITPQNANNRLKRLVAAGALRKERSISSGRGGKEFSYALPYQT
jgi:DNA-binding transcriptional ArsR family regulator